jgi:hypothetical protein
MMHLLIRVKLDPLRGKNCLQCEEPLNGQWRIHDTCIRARIKAIAAETRGEL